MRIAFYAPLKQPDHPVPSGDRRMAQLLGFALKKAGHEIELMARLRSYEGSGNIERQRRLAEIGGKLASRLTAVLRDRPPEQRPSAWLTYHLYYKAPDWIGPRVAVQLGIPYVVVEASVAMKRQGGPWSFSHEAVIAALRRASAVVSLNPVDDAGIEPHLTAPDRLHRLKPFLDAAPFAAAARMHPAHRSALAERFNLDAGVPWLAAVGMMRAGDKLASYRVLGEALTALRERPWQLIVAGDGPARGDVEAALAPLGTRVVYAGALGPDQISEMLAAADIFVWPAINEAWGMAILEAQAAGLPVVAGRSGGVPALVADGKTGLLTAPGDAPSFSAAVAALLDNADRRRGYGAAALSKVAKEHDVTAAGAALGRIFKSALAVRT